MNAVEELPTQTKVNPNLKKSDESLMALLSPGFDYLIVSDGSGKHQDKTGGACVAVLDKNGSVEYTLLSQSNTTVMRMEFKALLEGLELVRGHRHFFQGVRALWLCDNNSLVDCVNNSSVAVTNEDLWFLFDFYSSVGINVEGKHIPRENQNILHNLCDLHASTMREIFADYLLNNINFNIET